MARIRIHELAKKLGKENKEILNYLTEKAVGIPQPCAAGVPWLKAR